jgi:hypothetical protein
VRVSVGKCEQVAARERDGLHALDFEPTVAAKDDMKGGGVTRPNLESPRSTELDPPVADATDSDRLQHVGEYVHGSFLDWVHVYDWANL